MQADHYEVLGVPPDAHDTAIRAAYLDLMRAHHPDHRPGDAASAALARRANAAYHVLGDAARRDAYDRRRGPHLRSAAPGTAPGRPVAPTGYSPARTDYQRAFSLATARFLVGVLLVGALMLLVVAAR